MNQKIINKFLTFFLGAILFFLALIAHGYSSDVGNTTKTVTYVATLKNNSNSIIANKSNQQNYSTFHNIITDPTIAYILFLFGIYGLFFEIAHPGFVLPGLMGAIALILALYGFHFLPINYVSFSIMLFGFFFLIAEVFIPSFGILALSGIIAFIIGSIFLMHAKPAGYHIDWAVIIFMAILNAAFFIGVIGVIIRARRRKIVSGLEALIHMEGEALEDFQHSGWVLVNGERWQAVTDTPIKQHHSIRVIAIKNLKLKVEPIHKERRDL